jgi:MoaA/NifB/PqqE/SkfB family radical SAM enzyme
MKTVAVEHCNSKQAQVVKIEWNIGKRCNFNCSYCDEWTHDNHSPHMSYEIAVRTIDKIIDKLPGREFKINLTGGEPCVNPNFERILDYMYECGVQVGITTNGSRTQEFYQRNIHKLNSIIFSYHMEYHKRKVLPKSIVKLYQYKQTLDRYVHLHVHMMMLPTTFPEADTVMQYFRESGVPVVMRRIRPARVKDDPNNVLNKKGHLVSGPIAGPFYKGVVTQLMKDGEPYYGGDTGYYSPEEIEYLENNDV